MKRLFLDANVLFSAVRRCDSAQGSLVEFAAGGLIAALSSVYAIDEAHHNLMREAPRAMRSWQSMLAVIRIASEPDAERLGWAGSPVVAKNAPILASAVRAKVDWLVTGDRSDFGHLFSTTQRAVPVIPPSEAARRLLVELDSKP